MSWVKGLVNLHQTPEDRYTKYWAVIAWGETSAMARRMRDWRWTSIYRYFGLWHPNHKPIRPTGQMEKLQGVAGTAVHN